MDEKKQIDEIAKLICTYPQCIYYNIIGECANAECRTVDIAEALYNADFRKQSDVIEEYRQRVNIKMGKHTHLLGKEYVQRILREVAREMKGGAE
jgi:hypothetical protein